MKIDNRDSRAFANPGLRIAKLARFLLYLGCFAPWFGDASAFELDVQIADGTGGLITAMPNVSHCSAQCTLRGSGHPLLSLFAIPDPGYRFQRWSGSCASTIGPLCTFRADGLNQRTSAHFVKSEAAPEPAKAVLLLPDNGANHTVWNEFVKHRFNDRCPVVYGGVVLGADSSDPRNDVFCYRMDFGYYDAVNRIKTTRTIETGQADQQRAYEIHAAVQGILNRHPNLSVTLVAPGEVASVAQAYLADEMSEQAKILGLLALASDDPARDTPSRNTKEMEAFSSARGVEILLWPASPEQEVKIHLGLRALAKSWWTGK